MNRRDLIITASEIAEKHRVTVDHMKERQHNLSDKGTRARAKRARAEFCFTANQNGWSVPSLAEFMGSSDASVYTWTQEGRINANQTSKPEVKVEAKKELKPGPAVVFPETKVEPKQEATPTPEQASPSHGAVLVNDPELIAMHWITVILQPLEPGERARVLEWAMRKLEIS